MSILVGISGRTIEDQGDRSENGIC